VALAAKVIILQPIVCSFLTVALFVSFIPPSVPKNSIYPKLYLSKTLFFACIRTLFVQIPKIAKKFAIETV
jgi:hypothetical protein